MQALPLAPEHVLVLALVTGPASVPTLVRMLRFSASALCMDSCLHASSLARVLLRLTSWVDLRGSGLELKLRAVIPAKVVLVARRVALRAAAACLRPERQRARAETCTPSCEVGERGVFPPLLAVSSESKALSCNVCCEEDLALFTSAFGNGSKVARPDGHPSMRLEPLPICCGVTGVLVGAAARVFSAKVGASSCITLLCSVRFSTEPGVACDPAGDAVPCLSSDKSGLRFVRIMFA